MTPFSKLFKKKGLQQAAVVLIIACIGTYALVSSHAQTPYASVDASSGTLSNGATKVADSSTDNGYKAIFGGSTGTTQKTNCFSSPGACGYPDPAYGNVGLSPSQCAALPSFQLSDLNSNDYYYSGSGNIIEIYANNVTLSGYNMNNWTFIQSGASGLTFNGDCFETNGDNGTLTPVANTSDGTTEGSHLTVENSTIRASGCTVAHAASAICTDSSILSQDIGAGDYSTIKNNILVGSVESVNGPGVDSVIQNNYIVSDADLNGGHTENIYASDTSNITINHNTLLNPFDQTANIFFDNGNSSSCTNTGMVISDNLMAGGGRIMYACSGATSLGSSTLNFTNNDLARCDGTPTDDSALGGTECGSTPPINGAAYGAGADSHGYWPGGGFFDTFLNIFCGSGTTWSGNTWDDTGATIACQSVN